MLCERDIERVLDVIEITRGIDTVVRQQSFNFAGEQRPDDAIAELNQRIPGARRLFSIRVGPDDSC